MCDDGTIFASRTNGCVRLSLGRHERLQTKKIVVFKLRQSGSHGCAFHWNAEAVTT